MFDISKLNPEIQSCEALRIEVMRVNAELVEKDSLRTENTRLLEQKVCLLY